MDLVGGNSQGGGSVLFVLHVVVGVILSPLVQLDVAICGLVGGGMVGLSPFSWAVFVLDLDLGCVGGLWVCLWVLAVPHLWLVFFCSVVGVGIVLSPSGSGRSGGCWGFRFCFSVSGWPVGCW